MAIIPKEEKKTQNEVTPAIRDFVYDTLYSKAVTVIKERYPEIPKDNDLSKLYECINDIGAPVAEALATICVEENLKTKDAFETNIKDFFDGELKDELCECVAWNICRSEELEQYWAFEKKMREQANKKHKELLFQYEVGNIDGKKLEKEVKDWTPEV